MPGNALQAALDKALRNLLRVREHAPDRRVEVALLLIRLHGLDEFSVRAGGAASELLAAEFLDRVRGAMREQDEVISIEPRTCAVILKGIRNREHVKLAVSKLERACGATVELLDDRLTMRTTTGVAITSPKHATASALFRSAAEGMKQAHKRNMSHGYGDRTRDEPAIDKDRIARQISDGLNAGEFEMYFQPKVSAAYRNIIGAESLIRWHHSEQRVVGPNEFIPIAEAFGHIGELTFFAMKTSIAQAARWPGELTIAINIPPSVLKQRDLAVSLGDMLSIHNLPAERVTIEITESELMADPDAAKAAIVRMREIGVRFALDDFGTGYSSLAYLQELPIDELKIDRAFVARLQDDDAVIRSVLGLARNFGLKVVAEGVETDAQAKHLRELGCDYLQGYLFGRPAPPVEFRGLLEKRVR